MKNIKLADKAGFCFGVKRAFDKVLELKESKNKPIYTLGPLIHNNDAVNYLKNKEIYPLELENVKDIPENSDIIIRSHGVPPNVIEELKKYNIVVTDATCPFVTRIQKKAKEYYEEGYNIVILGDKNHPEIIGINGWCDNTAVVSKNGEGIEVLKNKKICLLSQTTEKQENFDNILDKLKDISSNVVYFNTICSATEERQKSAVELAENSDLMVVIGGRHSSNTTKLYELCSKHCEKAIHIENIGQLPKKINEKNIGVTAGASTPGWIIKEAISKMNNNQESLEMNEQLKFMNENEVSLHVGKVVKGEIISINDNEAVINLNYKADGVMPVKEATTDENVALKDLFNIGDTVDAKVINMKNEDGNVVVSRVELERGANFKDLEEAFENKTSINVYVKEVVNGGLLASFKGIRVFIPASHVALYRVNNLQEYVGKELEVAIIEFVNERYKRKIVGSRRALLQKGREKLQDETWNQLEAGKTVKGIVRRIAGFGAFVEIGGVDGLLHISEISWGKISRVENVLKVGQEIEVYILEANKETQKLSLSMKKITKNPWEDIQEKYPEGNVVLGKVVRFTSFGAFVELEPGVDGLIHISQISHNRIEKPDDVLKIGESVKAKIINVDAENKKIGLSIKQLDEI